MQRLKNSHNIMESLSQYFSSIDLDLNIMSYMNFSLKLSTKNVSCSNLGRHFRNNSFGKRFYN